MMDKIFNIKLLTFIILISVCLLSVGYSAFNSSLVVDDTKLVVRVPADIRITGLNVESVTNNGLSLGEDYDVDKIKTMFNLPKSTSTITYKLKITNFEEPEMGILELSGLPDYLDYTFTNYTLKNKICDSNNKCNLGIIKDDILLTIKYKEQNIAPSITDHDINIKFNFQEFYSITYSGITNNGYITEILGGDTLNITFKSDIPNRINVYENGVELDKSTYTYQNGKLILTDVKADLVIEKGESTLVDGKIFSKTIKDLVNGTTSAIHLTADTKITYIGFYENEMPIGYTKETLEALPNVSVSSDNKIKAYNDNGKVYVYSKNDVYTDANMNSMFRNMQSLITLDLLVLDTSKTTDMKHTFKDLKNITSLNLSNFNSDKVIKFEETFSGCSSLTNLDLSSFNTSNAINMYAMFNGCSSLTSLDISSFNTSKITDMSHMFQGDSALKSLNFSNFDTSKVTSFRGAFESCSALTSLDLSHFDTSNATTMRGMFYGNRNLTSLDLSSFDTAKVTDITNMFAGSSKIKTIYVSDLWNTDAVTESTDMFTNASVLVGGNGTKYNSSIVDKTYARIDTADTPGYFTYKKYIG